MPFNHQHASTNTDSPYGMTGMTPWQDEVIDCEKKAMLVFFGGMVQSTSVGVLLDKLQIHIYIYTLWLFNITMENHHF